MTRFRPRVRAACAALVVAGQFASACCALAQTGVWTNAAPLAQATVGAATVAANGLIYAVGGSNTACTSSAAVAAYDPVANTWTAKASLGSPLSSIALAGFNGALYAIGGGNGCTTTGVKNVAAYNLASNNWTAKTLFPFDVRSAGAAVANGTLYVLGGEIDGNNWTNTVYAYNFTNDSWSLVSTLPSPRSFFACAEANNIIYIIGGGVSGAPSTALWAFNPAANTWTTNAAMPVFLQDTSAAVLDGIIFVAGGETTNATFSTTVEAYNPLSNIWSSAPSLPTAILGGGCAAANGELFVAGGETTGNTAISTVQALAVVLPPSIISPPVNMAVSNTAPASFSVSATGAPPPAYQWLKDAAPLAGNARISGVTAGTLAFSSAIPSDAGFYSVIISNSGGAITSAPVLLTVETPEKTAPAVTVASPTQNEKFTTGAVTLSGTTRSSTGVAAVWHQLNGGGWLPAATANNWSNWTGSITLAPYTNSIQVCAADTAGNLSPIKVVKVTYVMTSTLTVTAIGSGTVTPNENGQLLQIGKTYTITAKPKAGYVLSSWTMATNGGVFSSNSNPALTFVMQAGLQLTAAFGLNPQPLTVAFSVSSTNLVESAPFIARVTVKNTGTAPIEGMYVNGEALSLDGGGTGFAVPEKFISPVITSLAVGRSVTFMQPFKATTAGTFRLFCVIDSSLGSSSTNYSPYIAVYPSKLGVRPQTDGSGNGRVTAGNVSLPVSLFDEETGSSLSGFALGLALDPNRKGQAILAAVDTAGRYPPQFFLLRGPSEPTESSLRKNRVIVAGGSDVEKTDDSAPAAQPMGIPVDQACSGVGGMFQHVMTPIATTALPPLAPLAAPPSPSNPGPDNSQPAAKVLLEALQSAGAAAKNFVISKKEADCDEVLADDAAGLAAGKAADLIFAEAPERFLSVFAPGTAGIYTAFMTADTANSYYQSFRDLALCNGSSSSGVVLQTTLLPQIQPYFPSSFLTWNSQVEADNTPLPLVVAAVQTIDQNGNPISGGSIEMFSTNHLGSGFRAVIEDGMANLPVLADDTYDLCARAPGYVTQSQQVSVTSTNMVVQVLMPAQPVKSAMLTSALGQPTGFLAKGTQFTLTPHFYDANGNEVACTGQPIFYVHNPVGSTVATVDSSSGVVTMQDGCGAATIFVWCNGIESAPKLISSDCNGSQPPVATSTFAVNPTALVFSATEGGGNPASQNFYVVSLTSGTVFYTAAPSASWIVLSATGGHISVGVNISGLGAGSHVGTISVVDTNATQNEAKVTVALTIKGTATSGGGGHKFDGSWSGSYSGPYTYTGGSISQLSGDVDVLIEDGVLTAESPVDGMGTLDGSGNVSWQATPNNGETPFVFTGTFTSAGTASGTWTLTIPTSNPGQSGSGSGTWTATRTFP